MIRTVATAFLIAGIVISSCAIYQVWTALGTDAVAEAAPAVDSAAPPATQVATGKPAGDSGSLLVLAEPATPAPATPAANGPVAVPVKSPSPPASATDPGARLDQALAAAVARAMTGFPGTYSVAVYDLTSKHLWLHNPDAPYHPASTIKMPVTLYAVEQYRQGKLKWSDLMTYTAGDYETPGGGALETSPVGSQYTVENLVGRSLMYSNNIAVNILGRSMGWENVRAWSRTIGGDLVRLPDGSPQVTVRSELGWWRYLEQLSHDDPKAADLMLGPLKQVAYQDRIPAGLPADVPHVHKFGNFYPYFHDGALIWGDRPYILVVMTNGGSGEQADSAIAAVARAVHPVVVAQKGDSGA